MKVEALVINLDRSPQRLATITDNLTSLDIPFTRISALDGQAMSESELQVHYSSQLNAKQHFRPLNKGEIACYLSHRKACQYIVDNNLNCALVLEDDTVLSKSVMAFVEKVAETHGHWDLIKLCHGSKVMRKIASVPVINGYDLTLYDKVPSGAWVQLISQQGAAKFLKMSEKFGRPIDQDLRHWWKHEWRILGVSENLATHIDEASDIDEFKGQRKKRDYSRLRRTLLKWKFAFGCKVNKFKTNEIEAVRDILNN